MDNFHMQALGELFDIKKVRQNKAFEYQEGTAFL